MVMLRKSRPFAAAATSATPTWVPAGYVTVGGEGPSEFASIRIRAGESDKQSCSASFRVPQLPFQLPFLPAKYGMGYGKMSWLTLESSGKPTTCR